MKTKLMTRVEAVEAVGEAAVAAVESANCEPTNRVLETPGVVEFAASIRCDTLDGDAVILIAYYYQTDADLDCVDDLGALYWDVEGFEII